MDSDSLEIQVDTEVHVPSTGTPRRVVAAIRRQLRQHDLPSGAADELRSLLNLMSSSRGGSHRLPQALLPRVTEICHRYGVPFSVVDRRAMVACPALRSNLRLTAEEEVALRPLLLHDSGVLVAPGERSRQALAVELAARRQQRTLLCTTSEEQASRWVACIGRALGLEAPHVQRLPDATGDSWVTVARYSELPQLPESALRTEYGMLIFDELSEVDALTLTRTVRASGARYMLGLADEPVRHDGLHQSLFMTLGGIVQRLASPRMQPSLRLALRTEGTEFQFPAYSGRKQYQAMIAALAADSGRAELVARDVTREADEGRPCLVLSERRDHVEHLARCLPHTIRHQILTSAVRPAERQRILSSYEQGQLSVLLATSQLSEALLCSPHTERLFLTFPFSYARKLDKVVRALLSPVPGQQDAVLYDYDDLHVDPLHRAFVKRQGSLAKLRRETERAAQLELPL